MKNLWLQDWYRLLQSTSHKGNIPMQKGKSYEEIYGVEKSKDLKSKCWGWQNGRKREPANKGLTKENDDKIRISTEKMKETKRKKFIDGIRVKSRKRLQVEEQKEIIIELYMHQNKTIVEISKLFNTSYFLIRKILEENKVPINFHIKPLTHGQNVSKALTGKTYEDWYTKEDAQKKKDARKNNMKNWWVSLPEEKRLEIHKKCWKNRMKRPTSFEFKIIQLCKENNLPYKYVGNGEFVLARKNPDFINTNGEKKIIETYYTKIHPVDYEQKRGDLFSQYGFKTIFINEFDLNQKDWKDVCLNKIVTCKLLREVSLNANCEYQRNF